MVYQERFSETHPEMYDSEARKPKADKVLAILEDRFHDLGSLRLLDFGCSNGMMTTRYGERLKEVVGVDIDEPGIAYAIAHNSLPNVSYRLLDGIESGQPDGSFDIVTCTHVYEHVPDPHALMEEISRILRPGGVCVFIAGNRLTLVDADNRLPLLSLLPRWLADRYVRVARKGDRYHERLYGLRRLKALVARFDVEDYTQRIVGEPERFAAEDMVRSSSPAQRLALLVLRHAYWLSPTYVWLLTKRGYGAPGGSETPASNSVAVPGP